MKLKYTSQPLKIKNVSDDGVFEGYGSVFDVKDSYGDIVTKGAFEKSLADHSAAGSNPILLWQHDSDFPIGKYTDIHEDDYGLKMTGQLFIKDNVPMADTAYTLLKRGGIGGMSIGYSVPEGGAEYDKDSGALYLNEVKLWETSLVTFPANEAAMVTDVRAEGNYPTVREFEQMIMRDANLSRTDARIVLSKGYRALLKQDAEDGFDAGNIIDQLNQMVKNHE